MKAVGAHAVHTWQLDTLQCERVAYAAALSTASGLLSGVADAIQAAWGLVLPAYGRIGPARASDRRANIAS